MSLLEVDGSTGGGQILRSALALAGITGETVRVENVRGNRDQPGLKHQHLACVDAAAAVCDATVDGDDLGSETLTFAPGTPAGGDVAVDVGTAGAVTLVFETVLPLATVVDDPIALTVTGGTDVAWSPSLAYYDRVRLPLARQFGWHASVSPTRRGFYPRGGGAATLHVAPSTTTRATVDARGPLQGCRVDAVASTDLADADVPARMASAAIETLDDADCPVQERTTRYVDAPSTGASILVALDYEHTVAGWSALGEPGKPAGTLGEAAAANAVDFQESTATTTTPPAVDEYAADQLVLPLALAGGRVTPARITSHVETNCAVARHFGFDVHVDDDAIVGD